MVRSRMLDDWGLVFLAALVTSGGIDPESERCAANSLFDLIYEACSDVVALRESLNSLRIIRSQASGHAGVLEALRLFDRCFLANDEHEEDSQFLNIRWELSRNAVQLLVALRDAGGKRGKPVSSILQQWRAQVTLARQGQGDRAIVDGIYDEFCTNSKFRVYSAHANGVEELLSALRQHSKGTAVLSRALGAPGPSRDVPGGESFLGESDTSLEARLRSLELGRHGGAGGGAPTAAAAAAAASALAETDYKKKIAAFSEAHKRAIYDAEAICQSGCCADLRGKLPNSLADGQDAHKCWLCAEEEDASFEQVDIETYKTRTGGYPSRENLPSTHKLVIKHFAYLCPRFKRIVAKHLRSHPDQIGQGVFKPMSPAEFQERTRRDCQQAGIAQPRA